MIVFISERTPLLRIPDIILGSYVKEAYLEAYLFGHILTPQGPRHREHS